MVAEGGLYRGATVRNFRIVQAGGFGRFPANEMIMVFEILFKKSLFGSDFLFLVIV